jgi:hypothetical protein
MSFIGPICVKVPDGDDPYSRTVQQDDQKNFLGKADGVINWFDLNAWIRKYDYFIPNTGLACKLYQLNAKVRAIVNSSDKFQPMIVNNMIDAVGKVCAEVQQNTQSNMFSMGWLDEFCKTQIKQLKNAHTNTVTHSE